MATSPDVIAHLVDTVRVDFTPKKMFGEYGLFVAHTPGSDNGDVMFGLVCDDRLFLRDAPAAIALLDEVVYGHPYPASKPYLVVDESLWSDRQLIQELFAVTIAHVRATKAPKKKKQAASPSTPKKTAAKKTTTKTAAKKTAKKSAAKKTATKKTAR